MEKIRVLQIIAGSGGFGGMTAFFLNVYRRIDRDRFVFDFLKPDKTNLEPYRAEIEGYGGEILELGVNASSIIGKIRLFFALKRFLADRRYDIIHINSGKLMFNYTVETACRRFSDAVIVVHSHNNGGRTEIKERLSGPLKAALTKGAAVLLACSDSAAEYMFPLARLSETTVIKNGIDAEKYAFNPEKRERLRREMGLEGRYVIGHVGRFTEQKNHAFLINLLAEIRKEREDAVLMLIGDGPLMDRVREQAARKGVSGAVLFLGARDDAHDLYQAMDVFVLPSVYEGFGIVNLEAQASGLKCVVSDAVPESVDVTGNVARLSLNAPLDAWKQEVLSPAEDRRDRVRAVNEAGFDIRQSAETLARIYEKALKEHPVSQKAGKRG